jgi:recombination protein RecA
MPPKEKKPYGRDGGELSKVLADIRKKDDLRIASLDEMEEVEGLSTGNILIDYITGVGGLPRGRLIELFGPPSSGKTTTALQTAVTAQREGKTVLYLDYEHALDPEYCQMLGLSIDPTFLFTQPDSFEQGSNAMRRLVETGELGLVIVDSVASMTPEKTAEIETGSQSNFGVKARLMGQLMEQLTPVLHRTATTCVFLNQMRDRPDLRTGITTKVTPGGHALKFYSSMRIEYRQVGNIKRKRWDPLVNDHVEVNDETKVLVHVVKNKVGPPFRKAEVRVRYGRGFSQEWAALSVLLAYGMVKKSGSTYRFDSSLIPRDELPESVVGEDKVLEAIEHDAEWRDTLATQARLLLEQGGAPHADAPPALTVLPELETQDWR